MDRRIERIRRMMQEATGNIVYLDKVKKDLKQEEQAACVKLIFYNNAIRKVCESVVPDRPY